MKLVFISIFGFLLLVSYQNCADVSQISPGVNSENGINKGENSGGLTCMALATPYVELSFDFSASNQTAGVIPAQIELEVNGEMVHSTCSEMPNGYVVVRKEGNILHIRQDYLDKGLANILTIKLYKKDSCSSQNRQELLNVIESPAYESYKVCATRSDFWEMTYLVN